jgi:hypothetical protein
MKFKRWMNSMLHVISDDRQFVERFKKKEKEKKSG